LRFKSELETVEKVWRLDRAAEINLDDIYRTLFFFNPGLKQVDEELKQTELRTELSVIVPSYQLLDYFNKARQLQKNVIFVSDTYLPKKHIAKVLEISGYKGYEKLFVSCEVGTNKASGKLFDVVINDMNVDPKYILHIGDSEYVDIRQAATRGINTYQVPHPAHLLNHSRYYNSEKYKTYYFRETASESLFRGVQKNYLMNKSKTKSSKPSSSYDIGYQILGPLCYGFISWVIQHAEEKNIKHLYFIAREGWFLKKIFDEINLVAQTGIISHYFYASRRALFFPWVSRPIGESLFSFLLSSKPSMLSEYLNVLELEIDDEHLKKLGFTSKEEIIDPYSDEHDSFRFKALLDSETEQLERLANEEKSNYLEYLQEVGMLSTNQIGLVDSGWFGNGQKKLQKFIELSNPETNMFGFYLALHEKAKSNFDEKSLGYGYLYQFDNFNDDVELFLEIARIFEVFLSAPAESLKKFSKKDGVIFPVFMKEENNNLRLHPSLEEIHEGALDFVKEFVKVPTLRIPNLPNYLATNLLEQFIENPTQEEAFNIGTLPYDANLLASDTKPKFAFSEISLANFLRNPLSLNKEFKATYWRSAYYENHKSQIIKFFLRYTQRYFLRKNVFSIKIYNMVYYVYQKIQRFSGFK